MALYSMMFMGMAPSVRCSERYGRQSRRPITVAIGAVASIIGATCSD